MVSHYYEASKQAYHVEPFAGELCRLWERIGIEIQQISALITITSCWYVRELILHMTVQRTARMFHYRYWKSQNEPWGLKLCSLNAFTTWKKNRKKKKNTANQWITIQVRLIRTTWFLRLWPLVQSIYMQNYGHEICCTS